MKRLSLASCLLLLSLGLQAQLQTFFIDFGPNDITNGNITTSPDVNGNHWNNITNPSTSGSPVSLVDETGAGTSASLEITTTFSSNGILNGGLLAPEDSLLGELAIATATQDYFFTTGNAGFTLSGLTPGAGYVFGMFGTRQSASVRESLYTLTGANTSLDTMQTSGPAIGAGGYNGNNNTVVLSDTVYADAQGQITFSLGVQTGGFAYLGMMQMEQVAMAPPAPPSFTYFIDFGPNDVTNGNITNSPDANGNYWNNITNVAAGSPAVSLVDVGGTSSAASLQVTTSFVSNGILNGGLLAPEDSLLGELAIATATQDYFFTTGSGGFTLSGLTPGNGYAFGLFGTRQSASVRQSIYTLSGVNTTVDTLQTSGPAIGVGGYNGNNDQVLMTDTVYVDASGEISFTLSVATGGFAYLGLVRMEKVADSIPPTNAAPMVDAGADQVLPAGSTMATLTGSATDPDMDSLSYSWAQLAGPTVTFSTSMASSTDVMGLADGNTYSFSLTATDGSLSDTDTVSVTVDIPGNQAPTADAGMDIILPAGSVMTSLMGIGSDPDGDPLTYSWNQIAGAMTTLSAPNSANTDVMGLMDGNDYAFELTVSDSDSSDIDTVNVSVRNAPIEPVGRVFFVDLGKDDVTNGNPTIGPDVNGNYWNNLLDASASGTPIFLVDTDNNPSAIEMQTATSLLSNGIQNGGLLAPEDSLLGELAIATATEDYFFTVSQGTIVMDDLNPDKAYRFSLFGSRNTDITRRTAYTLIGATTYQDTLQSSGLNIGGNGYNGNNRDLVVTPPISPDADGQISITLAVAEGGFAYLNMMRIEEIDNAPRYLVDFGPNDVTNGNITQSPDLNGLYWNNVTDPIGSTSDTVQMIDNRNQSHGAYVKVTGTFGANGIQNGGLLSPDPALLGDLAIATATQDYFFTGGNAGIEFGGLDTSKGYVFTVFGTRNTSVVRRSSYTFTGNNSSVDTLQTSGPDLGGMGYDGNTMSVAVSDTVFPNGSGIITLDVGTVADLAYIGLISIREVSVLEVPTPDPIIAVMGSSVADGFGAANSEGYAFRYTQLLEERALAGEGGEYNVINISVGGNTTIDVSNRWDSDLAPLNAQYVMYGLSLANEGIFGQGQGAFDQFRDNMLTLIQRARDAGIEPIVVNCYANGNFGPTQYQFTKDMNLLIHEWDVASVNSLGAIDDGAGKWVSNYQSDPGHPNTAGHREMSYSIVPSLFDALEEGKPQPVLVSGTYLTLDKAVANEQLSFTPDAVVHSFTHSFEVRTTSSGTIGGFTTDDGGYGGLVIDPAGNVDYLSNGNAGIQGTTAVHDGSWHTITLTHYYAWGKTFLYVDGDLQGEVGEQLEPDAFILSEANGITADYREWFFYRAGMTEDEVDALVDGGLLKSSLELYAPLDGQGVAGSDELVNLAQSTNGVVREEATDFITSIDTGMPSGGFMEIFPNPTTNIANIRLSTSKQATVSVAIFDGMGRKVAQLCEDMVLMGTHTFTWQPSRVHQTAQVYICTVQMGADIYTKKLMVRN